MTSPSNALARRHATAASDAERLVNALEAAVKARTSSSLQIHTVIAPITSTPKGTS